MAKQQQKLSPAKYIKTKVRALPIHECVINESYQDSGMATVIVSRKMPSGNYVVALYNLDVFCLGLKNTLVHFNLLQKEYDDLIEKAQGASGELKTIELSQACNLIYGVIDFAEELGFKPADDFALSQYIIDPELIDDGIDDLEFGQAGKAHYLSGPYDNVPRILATLNKNVGEGNYQYTSHIV